VLGRARSDHSTARETSASHFWPLGSPARPTVFSTVGPLARKVAWILSTFEVPTVFANALQMERLEENFRNL